MGSTGHREERGKMGRKEGRESGRLRVREVLKERKIWRKKVKGECYFCSPVKTLEIRFFLTTLS